MGKPAARIGDMTAHGGSIVMGFPTVLIGGQPAARLADMHVCPMVNPAGPVPVPHVGGPIFMIGSPTVLIGGMPAARAGDMAICVGPPDVIAMGCFTVLIGEAGGGAGGMSAGAGGGGAAGSPGGEAIISAGIAMTAGGPGGETGAGGQGTSGEETGEEDQDASSEESEAESEQAHWIKFNFVDKAGNSISAVEYEFTTPDGEVREGRLGGDGQLQWSGPDAGQGKVKLMDLSNARWSEKKAKVGDTVKLTADVEGYESSTEAIFEVWERDNAGADAMVTRIESQVQGNKVETEWQYQHPESPDDTPTEKWKFSSPEYYFVVKVKNSQARSGMLELRDWVEITFKDGEDNPMFKEEYVLYLSDGSIRKGKLDDNGYKKEDNITPKPCRVVFPNISKVQDGS